jgi:hypothetical protein
MWFLWFLVIAFATVAFADDEPEFATPWMQITADFTGGNRILEAYTTLQLPSTPNMPSGYLVLWPGFYTIDSEGNNADLVQSICSAYSEDFLWTSGCHGTIDQWCAFGYTLEKFSTSPIIVVADREQAVNANTAMDISYIYDDSTGNVTQTLKVGGNVLSTLSTR